MINAKQESLSIEITMEVEKDLHIMKDTIFSLYWVLGLHRTEINYLLSLYE